MHLIVSKNNKAIIAVGEHLIVQENSYPFLEDTQTAYPDFMVDVFETNKIPEDYAVDKYCYAPDQGFYKNPDYVEPNKYGVPDETVQAIKDDTILDLIELGVL
ncbi:hypothetical protein ACPW7J_02270 [Ihubacter sp. rT4E-8]|uniref:hypothetical protein n=1 Tax=Ihubacter sp. rT4E-8 TaxID=3242369 RepID=UPI003CF67CB1